MSTPPPIDKIPIRGYLIRSYPIIISTLNMLALESINIIMISRLGSCYVASAVCANGLFNLFKRINSGLSISVALLVARAARKQNHNQEIQILKHALLLNVALAFIFFLVLIGVVFYLKSKALITLGRSYLFIIAISLIPSAINTMIRRYLEGIAHVKIGLLLGLLTLISNFSFNCLWIYGSFGFPMLGLKGAGIAITLSETLTAITGIAYICYLLQSNGRIIHMEINQIHWRYIKAIISIGWLAGLQLGVEGTYLLFITIIIGWIGIEAQATHAILFNICQLITIFAVGLGTSGSMYVAQQRSKRNSCLVKKTARTTCFLVMFISILMGWILQITCSYIISLYKPDPTIRPNVQLLMKHLYVFQIFYSLCYWGNSVLRGLNDRIPPFIYSIATQCIGLAICYIMVIKFHWSINSVWLILIFERMLCSLLLIMRFEEKMQSTS